MIIKLSAEAFEPFGEVKRFQKQQAEFAVAVGATSIFIGTMRDFNDGDSVVSMSLEYYPGMTERQLEMIVTEALERWVVLNVLVVHRVGDISPGDPIVLVVVETSHRGDAFDACRFIMEALKSKAPFWKKEQLASQQSRWVENNSKGYAP